jgi:glyceraldehyde-3-phosphate dehydrogenase/erythrose-4-phosphate dehydrogenase
VSVVDLNAIVDKKTTGEVNAALTKAADGPLKEILLCRPTSRLHRLQGQPEFLDCRRTYTKVGDGDFVKVLSWA